MTEHKRTEAEQISPDQHIDQDDSRYDGFRIRELWLLTTLAPDDQEGVIGLNPALAAAFHLTPGPALASDRRRLRHLREFARVAAPRFGGELRLRRFIPAEDEEIR